MRKTSPPFDVLWTPTPETLDEPLRARKPRKILVADVFDQPFEFIAACYGVAAACPQHTLCFLTKRPKRMREFFCEWLGNLLIAKHHAGFRNVTTGSLCSLFTHKNMGGMAPGARIMSDAPFPLLNVIHGYSAANQADLDAGIADLLATPSALRCLSLEPLIGPVDLTRLINPVGTNGKPLWPCAETLLFGIDWIITGGESGPGARPCDVAWIRSIVEQCKAAGVACFTKQLGKLPAEDGRIVAHRFKSPKCSDPSEWPADLRVREFPEVQA